MNFSLKTKSLFSFSVLMIGLVVWDSSPASTSAESLPIIDAIIRTDIDRVALTSMGNTITLEQQNGQWMEVAPLSGLADIARINSMILNFRNAIPMDVLIETDPQQGGKAYGLDSSNAITVELWRVGLDDPSISFLVGNDAGQGSSFVRVSGDKSVYRANVGGRRRFAYSASDWLNQRVFQVQMSDLASIQVASVAHPSYTLQNGEEWTVVGATSPVDVSRLVKALQDLLLVRIGSVGDETPVQSTEIPWLQMLLTTKDDTQIPVRVDRPQSRQTEIEVNGKRYQVPVLPFEHFTNGSNYFMDRRVFPVRSREELDLIRYTTATTDIIIQQDLSNGFWKVLQPSNVDLEMRDAFFMVNTLSTLSSIAEVPEIILAGKAPALTLEIRRLQGDVMRLRIFEPYDQAGVQGYLCQVDGMDSAFIAVKDDIERIINGFGQANVF